MKTRKQWLSFGLVQLVLSGLWVVCLYRAFVFFFSTRAEVMLTQSADANTDFRFSQHILWIYAISFLIGSALAWFMCRMRLPSLLVPILVICLTSVYIIIRQPEEVIVFFPSPAPYLALLINLFVGAIGGAIIARRKQ